MKNPIAGLGDILALIPGTQGRMCSIEVKKPGGRLSETQKLMHMELIMRGVKVIVAYSLDDVVENFFK